MSGSEPPVLEEIFDSHTSSCNSLLKGRYQREGSDWSASHVAELVLRPAAADFLFHGCSVCRPETTILEEGLVS